MAEGFMAKKLTSRTATNAKAPKAKVTPAPAKAASVTLEEALGQPEALGNEGVRAQNARSSPFGAGDNQFGVALGDVRALAKKIKSDHALAQGRSEVLQSRARRPALRPE